jgi:hypothetical protein
MRRLTIAMLLVAAGLWPTILESGDLTAYYVRYPCVIMQCQDWHYVLEAPGGKIDNQQRRLKFEGQKQSPGAAPCIAP